MLQLKNKTEIICKEDIKQFKKDMIYKINFRDDNIILIELPTCEQIEMSYNLFNLKFFKFFEYK